LFTLYTDMLFDNTTKILAHSTSSAEAEAN